MYVKSPGQKYQRNTNRGHRAAMFPLNILVLCGKQVFFLLKKKCIFFRRNKNFSKKINGNAVTIQYFIDVLQQTLVNLNEVD